MSGLLLHSSFEAGSDVAIAHSGIREKSVSQLSVEIPSNTVGVVVMNSRVGLVSG